MADNAKSWQDHNIHFRMAKEPEQMQEQNRVPSAFRNEEGGAEVPVGQQHGDGTGKHWNRQKQQKGCDQH